MSDSTASDEAIGLRPASQLVARRVDWLGPGPRAVEADLEGVFVLDRGTLDGQPRYFPELTGVLDKAWRFEIPL